MRLTSWPILLLVAVGNPAAVTVGAEPEPLRLPEGVQPEDLADPRKAAEVANQLKEQYPEPRPEGARMLIDILRGSMLNGSDGWFGRRDAGAGLRAPRGPESRSAEDS